MLFYSFLDVVFNINLHIWIVSLILILSIAFYLLLKILHSHNHCLLKLFIFPQKLIKLFLQDLILSNLLMYFWQLSRIVPRILFKHFMRNLPLLVLKLLLLIRAEVFLKELLCRSMFSLKVIRALPQHLNSFFVDLLWLGDQLSSSDSLLLKILLLLLQLLNRLKQDLKIVFKDLLLRLQFLLLSFNLKLLLNQFLLLDLELVLVDLKLLL